MRIDSRASHILVTSGDALWRWPFWLATQHKVAVQSRHCTNHSLCASPWLLTKPCKTHLHFKNSGHQKLYSPGVIRYMFVYSGPMTAAGIIPMHACVARHGFQAVTGRVEEKGPHWTWCSEPDFFDQLWADFWEVYKSLVMSQTRCVAVGVEEGPLTGIVSRSIDLYQRKRQKICKEKKTHSGCINIETMFQCHIDGCAEGFQARRPIRRKNSGSLSEKSERNP